MHNDSESRATISPTRSSPHRYLMPPTLTTCTACGSTCDDIRLEVGGEGHVTRAANACEKGIEWFDLPSASGPVATIDGSEATLDEAIARAAEILGKAKLPLVAGFEYATIEAIQAGVALADRLGGVFDWTARPEDAAKTLALQQAGQVTASLGEVAQRADMIVVWGADLVNTHPRHFERYLLEPTSPWIEGRAERTLVAIDSRPTDTTELADHAISIAEGCDYEVLAVLRSLVAGMELDATLVEQQTGVSLDSWQTLVEQMKTAKYGAVVYAGPLGKECESLVALTKLMADLTEHTRWVALPAGGAGNHAGAASVLAWQTGYPLGVSFAKGYPEYGPGEWTAPAVLARRAVDAALLVGEELLGRLPGDANHFLGKIPKIHLEWRDWSPITRGITIHTARPGLECAGTTQRADGVMLPMRAARTTDRPTAEAVLAAIEARLPRLSEP